MSLSLLLFKSDKYPQDNFLYALTKRDTPYYCTDELKAKFFPDTYGKMVKPSNVKTEDCGSVKLYLYDFKSLKRKPILLEDAQKMNKAHPLTERSPDNFTVMDYCGDSYPIWGMSPNYNWKSVCLSNQDYRKRLNSKTIFDNEDDRRFIFLGWIPSST